MDNEIERRRLAIDFGMRFVRLEGFVVDPRGIEIQERFINGEITAGEMIEVGLKFYSRAHQVNLDKDKQISMFLDEYDSSARDVERRRSDVQFAISSARLSGFVLGEEIRQQFELYVSGSMTCEQLRANCLARNAAGSLHA